MSFNEQDGQSNPPVKEGQLHNVAVVGFGKSGDPIVKIQKYTIFVKDQPQLKLKQEIAIKIEKTLPNFGFATMLEDKDDF